MSRDTQFLGFAGLLIDDLITKINQNYDDPTPQIQLIARRAYDLVVHTLDETTGQGEAFVLNVPDMTTWPEEESK